MKVCDVNSVGDCRRLSCLSGLFGFIREYCQMTAIFGAVFSVGSRLKVMKSQDLSIALGIGLEWLSLVMTLSL